MPNCKMCGAKIGLQQDFDFNGQCPACVRMAPIRKRMREERSEGQFAWGFVLFACIASIILVIIIGSGMSFGN